MQLDADDLLALIKERHPVEYELCRLSLLAEVQAAEIQRLETENQRLQAQLPASFTASAGRPYVLGDRDLDGGHG